MSKNHDRVVKKLSRTVTTFHSKCYGVIEFLFSADIPS